MLDPKNPMTPEEAGKLACERARQNIRLRLATDPETNEDGFLKRLKEMLDATMQYAEMDKKTHEWYYTKQLPDNRSRVAMLDLLAKLYGLADQKLHIGLPEGTNVTVLIDTRDPDDPGIQNSVPGEPDASAISPK